MHAYYAGLNEPLVDTLHVQLFLYPNQRTLTVGKVGITVKLVSSWTGLDLVASTKSK